MSQNSASPADEGYRWPAEWERHRGTWLSWPHNRETWPGRFSPIPARFAELARILAEHEQVNILAGGEHVMQDARRHLGRAAHVELIDIPTNDAWCRDHGPVFLQGPGGRSPALLDWDYNAWGGKYPPFEADNSVPRRIAELRGYRRFVPGLVLEGGAIDGNGAGTVLASAACLTDPNRNPGRSRSRIELLLRDFLAADSVIWLAGGELAGDDTNGHVDQLARFVAAATVVVAVEPDGNDVNHEPLARNRARLESLRDERGGPFDVIPLPLPAPKFVGDQRLPASYCNFYLANDLVLVPQFDDPADDAALGTLRDLFPDRTARGFDVLDILWGLGAIHCLTQQEPAPFLKQSH